MAPKGTSSQQRTSRSTGPTCGGGARGANGALRQSSAGSNGTTLKSPRAVDLGAGVCENWGEGKRPLVASQCHFFSVRSTILPLVSKN